MKFSELEFRRKVLPLGKYINEERSSFDFIIDGKSLSEYIGDDEIPLTPFGWGINKDFQLKSAERLINFRKSEFDNGLQSAYVCVCCGDEGCGAVMFEAVSHGSYVEWRHFVKSNGYPTQSEPDEEIDIKPFFFEIGHYQKAIGKLKSLIK